MKTFILYLISVITALTILYNISIAQSYTFEQIPNPYSNVTKAELYAGHDNSLHLIGLSDTLISPDTYYHLINLFLTTRNTDGFSNEFVVIDTGHTESWGYSGGEDVFNCSMAEDATGQFAVVWTKQSTSWTDVVNRPGFCDAPSVKFGIKINNMFNLIREYSNADNPQIVADQNNNFHFVRQSVSPLYPVSPDYERYGPDSNYYFITSKILYNQLQADGTSNTTIDLGNGFFPHIHIDKDGTIHLLWLAADSSNSKYFKLVYTRKSGAEFNPVIILKDSVHGQWSDYSVHDYPCKYSSFIDDSGRVYVGWTDNNVYNAGKIFLASLSQQGIVRVDSLSDLALWGSQAVFSVERSGIIHIIWRTLKYPDWSFHYSQGSSTNSLFSKIRTFQTIYSYHDNPIIFINDRGVADGIFSINNSIGYFKDLNDGVDTIVTIAPGIIGYGLNGPRTPRSTEKAFAVDNSGQIWVLSSQNGLGLMKIDPLATNIIYNNTNPRVFSLSQNYPNPFNPTTKMNYQVPKNCQVEISVYNIWGQKVAELFNGKKRTGSYTINWDAISYPSGMYFIVMKTKNFSAVKKCLLLK